MRIFRLPTSKLNVKDFLNQKIFFLYKNMTPLLFPTSLSTTVACKTFGQREEVRSVTLVNSKAITVQTNNNEMHCLRFKSQKS
jgi:hypothetical protein